MVCASGGQWARYIASKLTGPWTMANPAFAGQHIGGSSGPAFFPLPPPSTQGEPTHIISDGSYSTYSVGTTTVDDANFTVTGSWPTDFGSLKWTAAGVDDATGRILQVGWLRSDRGGADDAKYCPKVQGIAVCGIQAISSVYGARFSAEIHTRGCNWLPSLLA
jgi:hypothetical protein